MEGNTLTAIISIVVGIACFIIGILNRKGNISMLHSYHINNVSEENKVPFGKIVGIGMIINAFSLIIYGALLIVSDLKKEDLYFIIANTFIIIGLVIGLAIILFAIKKYNKKIFG